MSKKIAFVGSSGGNLYTQGGNNIDNMMKEVIMQAESAGMELVALQYVLASGSLDNVGPESAATLFELKDGKHVATFEGTLAQVNEKAKESDEALAKMIEEGSVDGIMFVSADPEGANNKAFTAASQKQIPMAGTGGSGVARTQALGCRVISASGTTGTTNRTRAVAFTTALSKEWGLKYMPVIGNTGAIAASKAETNIWKRISFRGIMMTSLPAFIAMALCMACSKIPGCDSLSGIFDILVGAIPIVICAIAAKQVSGLDDVGVVAGIVAGFLSVDGGIVGGLLCGILAGISSYYIIVFCFRHKVPGTTANIAAGGLGGLLVGLVGKYAIAPVALIIGNAICDAINYCISWNAIIAGAVAGLLIWPAIIGGVYHAAILPIVLLEMEQTGFSFLGAIDMTGLVMVSAGITLANILFPKQKSEAAVALPGFIVNVGFGTFVEAAYPFMFSSKLVFGGALISAMISGVVVGAFDVRGTAYVPCFSAPLMANEGKGLYFLLAMLVAAACAFVFTVAANKLESKKAKKTEE